MHEKLKEFNSIDEVFEDCRRNIEYMDCDVTGPNSLSILLNMPLHTYSYDGNVSAIELLLGRGAIVNAKGDIGYTPLHCAALGNNGAVIRVLLNRGADKTIQDEFGDTALDVAIRGKKNDAIRALEA